MKIVFRLYLGALLADNVKFGIEMTNHMQIWVT